MRGTRFRLVRFALAGIIPAAMLAACGATTNGEQEPPAGSGGVAGEGTGGSKAGAGTGGSAGGAGSGGLIGSGGAVNHAGTGGSGGAAGHAGASGANTGGDGGGPLPCGGSTCSASQYCVMPCCGGAPPACIPISGDGKCPAGTHGGCTFNSSLCTSPASCCQYDPCTPPAPFCADKSPVGCFFDPSTPRICRMTCA